MEYSKDSVDIMHIEDAVFQSVNNASRVTSVDIDKETMLVNGREIIIEESDGAYHLDLSEFPNQEEIETYMANIWNGLRMFPKSYADDVPTDDIEPAQAGRYVPTDVEEFYETYNSWIEECIIQTLEQDSETGFVQDSIDNILGIIVGELGKIEWPKSIIRRHGLRFHTHPEITFTADPSVADLEVLQKTKGVVGADAIASTFGVDDIYTISYTVRVEDEQVSPEEEVEDYIDTMIDLVEEELAIGKMLIDKGKLDLDKEVFGKDIREMARARVDVKEKKDMVRQIAKEGYRIEESWAVVE